ncbi:hypothetical protein BROUX41_003493 [Berkeleyomyces rouxiae]
MALSIRTQTGTRRYRGVDIETERSGSGILLQSAIGLVPIFTKNHTTRIWNDGPRLALTTMTIAGGAWSQIQFMAFLAPNKFCQPVITFENIIDQIARVAAIQFMLWTVTNVPNPTAQESSMMGSVMRQLFLLLRIGLGLVLAGFVRPDLIPQCTAESTVPGPLPLVLVGIDAVIAIYALVRFIMSSARKNPDKKSNERRSRKSFIAFAIGFFIWTGTSVALLSGRKGTSLFLRVALPATGLTVLLAIVANFGLALLPNSFVMEKESKYPEAPSPRGPPTTGHRTLASQGSVGSSATSTYPPSHYEDLKGRQNGTSFEMQNLGASNSAQYQYRIEGASGSYYSGQTNVATPMSVPKRAALSRNISKGKIVISEPVMQLNDFGENPLDKIATIDLKAAAQAEALRRQKRGVTGNSSSSGDASGLQRSRPSLDDRARALPVLREDLEPAPSPRRLGDSQNVHSTGSQLSPASNDVMRRRSPRTDSNMQSQMNAQMPATTKNPPPRPPRADNSESLMTGVPSGLPSHPSKGHQSRPTVTQQARNIEVPIDQPTVMLVQDFQYDNPAVVENIMLDASNKLMKRLPPVNYSMDEVLLESQAPSGQGNLQVGGVAAQEVPIVHRPRPIPRNGGEDRPIFPAELPLDMSRLRSPDSTRRSQLLHQIPASPSQLPPLPQVPPGLVISNSKRNIPGDKNRPLPNNTRSMNFKEKMDLFYTSESKTRSSNGSNRAPTAPTSMMPSLSPTDSIISASTAGMFCPIKDMAIPPVPAMEFNDDRFTRSSTSRNTIEDARRRSSPVLPALNVVHRMSELNDHRDDDSTVYGDSAVTPDQSNSLRDDWFTVTLADNGSPQQEGQNVPVMLEEEVPVILETRFHQQLGKDCPTFTHRKSNSLSRKKVPPAPILVGADVLKQNTILRAAEPSPLESPDHALKEIQAQLLRIEQGDTNPVDNVDRRALLNDLEKEIGAQESHWLQLHNGVRDSSSTLRTSPARNHASMIEMENAIKALSPAQLSAARNSRFLRHQNAIHPELQMDSRGFINISMSQLGSPTPPDSDDEATESEMLVIQAPSVHHDSKFLNIPRPVTRSIVPSPRLMMQFVCRLWTASAARPLSPDGWSNLWQPTHAPIVRGDIFDGLVANDVRPKPRVLSDPLPIIESTQLWSPAAQVSPGPSFLWTPQVEASDEALYQTEKKDRPLTLRPPRRSRRITVLPDILEEPKPLPNKRETLGIFQFPWGETSDSANVQITANNMFMTMPGAMGAGDYGAFLAGAVPNMDGNGGYFSGSYFDDYENEESDDGTDSVYDDSDAEYEDEDYEHPGNETETTGENFDESMLQEIATMLKSNQSQLPRHSSLLPTMPLNEPLFFEQTLPQSENDRGIFIGDGGFVFETPSDDDSHYGDSDEEIEVYAQGYAEFEDERPEFVLQDRDSFAIALEQANFPDVPKPALPSVPAKPSLAGPETTSLLWESMADDQKVAVGLAQTPTVWDMYKADVEDLEISPKPRVMKTDDQELQINSVDLWQQAPIPSELKSLLWTPAQALTPRHMLWSSSNSTPARKAFGLKQNSGSWNKHITSTAEIPGTVRASIPKQLDEEMQIKSSTLWAPKKSSVERQLLWSPPTVTVLKSFGLKQVSSKWAKHLTAVSEIPQASRVATARQPNAEMQIQSSTLWAPKDAAPKAHLMWSLPFISTPKSFGLKQLSNSWDKHVSAITSIPIAPRAQILRPLEDAMRIESSSLWVPQQATPKVTLLWSLRAPVSPKKFGLKQIPATWKAHVAATTLISPLARVQIPRLGEELTITSSALWALPKAAAPAHMMWSPPSTKAPKTFGLKQAAESWEKSIATISQQPPAPRAKVPKPVDNEMRLTSTSLWSPKKHTIANGPRLWTNTGSPPAPTYGLAQPPEWSASLDIQTPAPMRISKPAPTTSLPRIQNTAMWSSVPQAQTSTVNWLSAATPTSAPDTRCVRVNATPAEWRAALDEALSLSRANRRLVRAAHPVDWDAALGEALFLSLANRHLVRDAQAVDWAAALAAACEVSQ